jgi:hypothetical protein
MKTYAPKGLHGSQLRDLMAQLFADPKGISKFLRVSERCVWRWLKDDSCPWPELALLWHETPAGREASALDVGNLLNLTRGLADCRLAMVSKGKAQLSRLLAISDTGAANDPFTDGAFSLGLPLVVNLRTVPDFDNGYRQNLVFNIDNDPVIPNSVTPTA